MRSSARSTDRRQAGFTLLEVIIASSIFVVVMIVALQQVKESGDAARLSTVQADLRRTGERAMQALIKDLRSTQLVYCGARAASTTTGAAIEFAKVSGFDATDGVPILEGNVTGASANVIGNNTVIYRYQQPSGTCAAIGGDNNTGFLQFSKSTWSSYSSSPTFSTTLSQELGLPNDPNWPYAALNPLTAGFEITRIDGVSLPGLLTASVNNVFGVYNAKAKPVTLRLKLVLKRSSGLNAAGLARQWAWTTVDTMVELRPDGSY